MSETRKIIFFDGYCSLCNGVVDFTISRKKENTTFHFASLQSDFAKDFLNKYDKDASALETFFFYENGVVHEKSTAALNVSKHLKTPINWFQALLFIPSFIRNPIYTLIAKNRYKLFGKKDTCRMPTLEEKALFLG